jgi:D-alanyl-D-alanine carboxypeptidase
VKATVAALSILLVVGFLATVLGCLQRTPGNLGEQMQTLVANTVEKDEGIKNCVFSLMKGDGSFSWSGAAGTASDKAPMTKNTPIYIASVTKLYTATVVMRLSELGTLSLNDPMAKYLPGEIIRGIHVYQGKDYSNEITIRQLLSHSSGIADFYDEKGTDGKSMFEIFLENPDRRWTVDQMIERVRGDMKPNFPPGKGTSYSDTNFVLLGKIIEAVTGKPLQNAYEDIIFRPLGLKRTYLIGHDEGHSIQAPAEAFFKSTNITRIRSNGSYSADGGIVSTADEMIIFLKALNDGRIIRQDTLESMHDWHKLQFPREYGYGTMLFSLPWLVRRVMTMPPLWGHSGSTGSFLYYCQDFDLYMAGTIDQADAPSKPFFSLMYPAIRDMTKQTGHL